MHSLMKNHIAISPFWEFRSSNLSPDMSQKDPIVLDPTEPLPEKQSTIIFLHGLGDDGEGSGYGTQILISNHD